MTDYVEKLKQEAAGLRVVRACSTCRHRRGEKCRATGFYYKIERSYNTGLCDQAGRMWEPKPPSFWSRLGDAIIERIQGKRLR